MIELQTAVLSFRISGKKRNLLDIKCLYISFTVRSFDVVSQKWFLKHFYEFLEV